MAVPPFGLHAATPLELSDRLAAERSSLPYLVFRDAADRQRVVTLGDNRERVTIGRDPEADVVLDWDSSVSRAHAQLQRWGTSWALVDDGLSRNGSFVNDRRVWGRRRLCDGDELRFGDSVATFRDPSDARPQTTTVVGAQVGPVITPAQRRVLVVLCRPFKDGSAFTKPATNKEIAEELHVTVEAVKSQIRALFERLEIEDLPHNQKRLRLVEAAFASRTITRAEL